MPKSKTAKLKRVGPEAFVPIKKRTTFADALGDLLAEYRDIDADTIISELELQAMALRETSGGEE